MSEYIEQFWRDATADDVARVMKGETVEARFRDEESEGWRDGEFLGGYRRYHKLPPRFIDLDGATYLLCQVYDPPAWFVNKPDPGEGWRLLDPFTDEQPELGDCMFDRIDKKWISLVPNFLPGRRPSVWYRRRIETNNPEIPDSCNSSETPNSSRSREDIPSGWRVLGKDEERLAGDAYWSLGCKEWIIIGDDLVKYANELSKWHVIRQVFVTDFFLRKGVVADFFLLEGYDYSTPGGQTIRITEKGFEVV